MLLQWLQYGLACYIRRVGPRSEGGEIALAAIIDNNDEPM